MGSWEEPLDRMEASVKEHNDKGEYDDEVMVRFKLALFAERARDVDRAITQVREVLRGCDERGTDG